MPRGRASSPRNRCIVSETSRPEDRDEQGSLFAAALERVGARPRGVIEQREDDDFSTPLSQMLLEIREALAHAKEGSARIRDLVSDLLCLSSTSNGEAVAFDIHPVLESALNLTASEIRRRARLVKRYDEVPGAAELILVDTI